METRLTGKISLASALLSALGELLYVCEALAAFSLVARQRVLLSVGTYLSIVKITDRSYALSVSPRGRSMLRCLQAAGFLVMCGLVDVFALLIEIVEEYTDIVTFNDELSRRILLRSNTQLHWRCHMEIKRPTFSNMNG
jgi:hypothetical protein